jgi:acyl-coenzyme A thioesterase PaaI-like protein
MKENTRRSSALDVGALLRRTWILRHFPGGKRLFSRTIGKIAPFTGTINATVDKLGSGGSLVRMSETPPSAWTYENLVVGPFRNIEVAAGFSRFDVEHKPVHDNHLQSIHAAVLGSLLLAGTRRALEYRNDERGGEKVLFALHAFKIKYLKKARGTLTVASRFVGDFQLPALDCTLKDVECEIKDSGGDVVASGCASWKTDSSCDLDYIEHRQAVNYGALMNLAEMASGLALNYNLPKGGRSILVGFGMDMIRTAPAEGSAILCSCSTSDTRGNAHSLKVGENLFYSKVLDASGNVFAIAEATWRVEF